MTAVKLQRERALADRRREKQQQRRAGTKEATPRLINGEDADLAGIRPGPQPPQDWQLEE